MPVFSPALWMIRFCLATVGPCVFRCVAPAAHFFILEGGIYLEKQYAQSADEYQQTAKKYVINMFKNRKVLHIKNCCYWSSMFSEFYSFDNLSDAKNCGVESTLCKNCFKKTN